MIKERASSIIYMSEHIQITEAEADASTYSLSSCTEPSSSISHTSTASCASTRKVMIKSDWEGGV